MKLGARGEEVLVWGLTAPVCCHIFQCLLLDMLFKCLIISGHIQYQVQSQNHTGQLLSVSPFPPSDLAQSCLHLISKSQEAINEGGLLPRPHMEHICFTFKSVPQFPSPGPKPFKRHMALRPFISLLKFQVGLSLGICVLLKTDSLTLPTYSH